MVDKVTKAKANLNGKVALLVQNALIDSNNNNNKESNIFPRY